MRMTCSTYPILVVFIVCVLVSETVQADEFTPDRSCNYERKIHDLSETLRTSEGSQDRAEVITKRIDLINDLHQLDIDSQFTFCSNEDGKATLKFNTPEEQLRDSIERLVNLIAWFNGVASKLGTAVATGFVKQLETDLKRLRVLKKDIDKYKTAGLTNKGTVEEVFPEYEQLRKQRREAMEGLADRADTVLCLGVAAEDMELARLYHETIPEDSTCNPLLKSRLLDRIRQSQTIGFGALLEKETYQRTKVACTNVEPLESDAGWSGRRVVVTPTKYPPGHVWFVAVSPTSLKKTIKKTFRDGETETVQAKVTSSEGPPSKLTVGRPTNEEVNFVVEGEISGFIKEGSAEGMANDLRCLNCEFKVLGGYQQIHERQGRNCSQTGIKKELTPGHHFFPRVAIGTLDFCRRKFRYEIQVVATSKKKSPEIHLKGPSLSEIIWAYDQRN